LKHFVLHQSFSQAKDKISRVITTDGGKQMALKVEKIKIEMLTGYIVYNLVYSVIVWCLRERIPVAFTLYLYSSEN
jgi:hypothetical protein